MVVKDILIWEKTNPMPRNIKRRYVSSVEYAIWAVKKKSKWVFHKPAEVPYHKGIFRYSIPRGKDRHPTQKSLELMKDIIQIHTNEEDVILDPFMGGGTTGIACNQLNRDFIGVEKEKEYFELAKSRLLG